MALGTKEYSAKSAKWLTTFRSHKKSLSLPDEKSLAHVDEPRSIHLKIMQVDGIQVPPQYKSSNDSQFLTQTVFTLYSSKQGFFGRSHIGPTH